MGVFSTIMGEFGAYDLEACLNLPLHHLSMLYEQAAFRRQEDQIGAFAGIMALGAVSGASGTENKAALPKSASGITRR